MAPRTLVVFSGRPGVGKSTLARLVAERIGAEWLRVDEVEAALLEAGLRQSFETGLAAYLVVRDRAAACLRLGGSVVVDAVNGVEPARAMWRRVSEECGCPRFAVEVLCSDKREHRRRVESRSSSTPPLPAPSWDDVARCEYHPWEEPVLRLEGTDPPSANLQRVLNYCSGGKATGRGRRGGIRRDG